MNASTHVTAFEQLIQTADLPALGPERRASARAADALLEEVDRFLIQHNVPTASHDPYRSAALLWHDHLEESHRISQHLHSRSGSFLHGMMHRREPDYANAKYWFRQVGNHAAFPEIAHAAQSLLAGTSDGAHLASNLLRGGNWNPDAFVDACEEHGPGSRADSVYRLLQEIQAIEFRALLGHL